MSRANVIFHELLAKKGIKGRALKRNIRNCEGCGFCCYGCPSGAKQSMDVSYLPKAFARGAKAFTNCSFERLVVEGKSKVTGIVGRFHDGAGKSTGRIATLSAPIVILAAGTIYTPQLLRNNGVAVENRHLGRNLTLHPATKVFARFDEQIRGWEGTPQAYYLDTLADEGITFEGIFVPPDVAAMTVPFVGRRLNEFMRDYAHMASFGFMISDSSTGRVVKLPLVGTTVLYNMMPEDVEKIRKGVAFLSRLFLEGGATKVYTLLHGYTELASEQDVRRLESGRLRADDIDGMAFHPLGTCRMGISPEAGVVGPDYRVFGWDGLYVCDGSVIPSSLGVNPQVTIMAFATRLAFQILGKPPYARAPQYTPMTSADPAERKS
jgi:choline dehydrogenase-like flavoprotein